MPRSKIVKVDKYVTDEKMAGYSAHSYAEAVWLTTRYLQHILPPAVVSVLVFVIHRTMRYHKDTDAISLSQFVKGIVDKDSERLITGACGYSKSTVAKALNFLEEMQLISRTKVRDSERGNAPTLVKIEYKNVFQLVKSTVHDSKKGRNMARINLAKRFKEINTLDTPPCPIPAHGLSDSGPTPCPIVRHTQSDNTQSDLTQSERPSATSGRRVVEGVLKSISKTETVKQTIATVVGKSQATRAGRAASARADKSLTVDGVNALWHTAMKTHHPDVPFTSLTLKTFAIFKKAATTHHVKDLGEFVDWVVDNWLHNRTHSLQWYKDGGAKLSVMPDLDQFARLYKHFVRLYADEHIGVNHRIDETAKLKRQLAEAEAGRQKAEDRAARVAKEAERAIELTERQIEAAKADAARAIRKASVQSHTIRETKSMEEIRDEMMSDEFSENLPEWKDG